MTEVETMAMLERRRIEAGILKHVYDTLRASHGDDVAKRTIASAVRSASIEQAQQLARAAGPQTSLETFIAQQEPWRTPTPSSMLKLPASTIPSSRLQASERLYWK